LRHQHGSLAGAAMPSHRLRCRCASHRADAIAQELTGTARSLHGDPFGSPVRYASLVPIAPAYRPCPSRSHRGHACACRASYASTGAVRPKPGSLAVPQCLRIASTSYASLGHPVLRTDP
jgi:hypothetical protein